MYVIYCFGSGVHALNAKQKVCSTDGGVSASNVAIFFALAGQTASWRYLTSMIVLTADRYRVAYQKFALGAYNMLFLQECGRFIALKNEKLGSVGQLKPIRLELVS